MDGAAWNQPWGGNWSVSGETAFTGGFDLAKSGFNTGACRNSGRQCLWFWLGIPAS